MDDKLQQKITEIFFRLDGTVNSSKARWPWIEKHMPQVGASLKEATSFLPDDRHPTERIYYIKNGWDKPLLCPVCDNKIPLQYRQRGEFADACSLQCSSKLIGKLSSAGTMKKYGVANSQHIQSVRDKLSAKISQRWQESSVEILSKRAETCMQKYGRPYTSKPSLPDDVRRKISDKKWLTDEHHTKEKSIQQIASELDMCPEYLGECMKGVGVKTVYRFRSDLEKNVADFFVQQGFRVSLNDREILKPKEVDVYLPDHKVAVEFNGMFYHSYGRLQDGSLPVETMTERNRHLEKLQLAESKGIRLYQIFEGENLVAWKGFLLSQLRPLPVVGARTCQAREVPCAEAQEFYAKYHIGGGGVTPGVTLGLYTKNQTLACCMSFQKFTDKWQLVRLCSSADIRVAGGASKLFAGFVRHYCPTFVVTYADRRYSVGDVYPKIGFKLHHVSKPTFYYCDCKNKKLLNRRSFQKHMLSKKLPVFDQNLTEAENMFVNGYRRIWDCGHLCFVWNKA